MTNQKNNITIFAPATVANVNCGFDTLGFALEGIGDTMVFTKVPTPGVRITQVTGADIPLETSQNVAGVAAQAMLDGVQADFGVEIAIHKRIRPGSGIGSSSASAAGAVFGVNQLLDKPLSLSELTQYAMKGEAIASGQEHADNVAPCLYGGITLVTGYDPLHIVALPVPELYVGILHPHIKIATKDAREILPKHIPLKDAIAQTQYLSGFVAALYTQDTQLLENSIKDVLITPYRKALIPYYDELENLAKDQECFAFGISGSGPGLFSLSRKKNI